MYNTYPQKKKKSFFFKKVLFGLTDFILKIYKTLRDCIYSLQSLTYLLSGP